MEPVPFALARHCPQAARGTGLGRQRGGAGHVAWGPPLGHVTRPGQGKGSGGAEPQTLGGQRDRLAVERLTGGRAALGPRQSWRRAWTRLRRRRWDVERVGPCTPVALRSVWAALASWDGRTGAHCCCLHPTWEIICTLSPACSKEVHCSIRTYCSPRSERTLAGPI